MNLATKKTAADQAMPTISQAILSIAGSDPSGGAGIQADLKTYSSLGVFGCAAISCLTVQNSLGVFAIQAVEPELVKGQIIKVLNDLPVSHIKTGMLGNAGVVSAVGECLASFTGMVICDPVLKASDGHDLLRPADIDILSAQVITRSTAITPNFEEFQAITGLDSNRDEDIAKAAASLFYLHPRLQAIVVKGGHRSEADPIVTDTLFIRTDHKISKVTSQRPRLVTTNTHGTGCTYASALTAYHLKTGDWQQAFQMAGDFVAELLRLSINLQMGKGTGPLWHHLFKGNNDC